MRKRENKAIYNYEELTFGQIKFSKLTYMACRKNAFLFEVHVYRASKCLCMHMKYATPQKDHSGFDDFIKSRISAKVEFHNTVL